MFIITKYFMFTNIKYFTLLKMSFSQDLSESPPQSILLPYFISSMLSDVFCVYFYFLFLILPLFYWNVQTIRSGNCVCPHHSVYPVPRIVSSTYLVFKIHSYYKTILQGKHGTFVDDEANAVGPLNLLKIQS